jgi:MoaA/NifB/PqqE/SkfB family radical SAM enzyme
MRLEEIGFYTLEDARATNASVDSPLWRCELILTDACNFKCSYCRPLQKSVKGTLAHTYARKVIQKWCEGGLKNIRFSGGEPTIYLRLEELVSYAKSNGVERIAVSTNGSATREKYDALLKAGVNDFSVSLDACCASDGDTFAGGVKGSWEVVVDNIRYLSAKCYVTVGIVGTNENLGKLPSIIEFASSLGVADIRLISAAQLNHLNPIKLDEGLLKKHPILKYRIRNLNDQRGVRGLKEKDFTFCPLVLDDMAVAGNYHFPCIITLREGHRPIGTIDDKSIGEIREERRKWMYQNDTHLNPICRANCLDVCIDYNNQVRKLGK